MENKQPTPLDALGVLDQATLPSNAGKLNRADYANVQAALQLLHEFIVANTANAEPEVENKPRRGRPPAQPTTD